MGFLGGSKPDMPKVQTILPIVPEVGPDPGDEAARKARQRAGYRKTILTGPLEPQSTGKKETLG